MFNMVIILSDLVQHPVNGAPDIEGLRTRFVIIHLNFNQIG